MASSPGTSYAPEPGDSSTGPGPSINPGDASPLGASRAPKEGVASVGPNRTFGSGRAAVTTGGSSSISTDGRERLAPSPFTLTSTTELTSPKGGVSGRRGRLRLVTPGSTLPGAFTPPARKAPSPDPFPATTTAGLVLGAATCTGVFGLAKVPPAGGLAADPLEELLDEVARPPASLATLPCSSLQTAHPGPGECALW